MAQSLFQNYLVRFTPGEMIFTEGDPGATMFVVQSGLVRLYREIHGEQVTISTMEKGDFFGEMSLLEGIPRTCSAQASEDCDLIEINSTTFDRMIKGNIEIAVRMLRKLCARLREAESRIGLTTTEEHHPMARSQPVSRPSGTSAPKPEASEPLPAVEGAAAPEPSHSPTPWRPGAPADASAAASAPAVRPGPSSRASAPAPAAVRRPTTLTPSISVTAAPRSSSSPTQHAAGPAAQSLADSHPMSRQVPADDGAGPRLTSETGDVTFSLTGKEALVGRYDPVTSVQPEVDLTSLDMKRSVSRRHARITMNGGVYELCEEAGVLNGTFLNGTRLVAGRPVPLSDGDIIGMGSVRLYFRL